MKGFGEGFDAQAGFVNRLRSNVVNGHAFNRLTHYGARGALLENLTLFGGPAHRSEQRQVLPERLDQPREHVPARRLAGRNLIIREIPF